METGRTREWVVRHEDGGYNRGVVDLASGVQRGGLCVNCERNALGDLGAELGPPAGDRCVRCRRDGLWALPRWLPSTSETERGIVSSVAYDAKHARLRRCDEHLAGLGVETVPVPVDGGPESTGPSVR